MGKLSKIHFQDEYFIRKNSLQCQLFLQIEGSLCKIIICDNERNVHNVEEIESKEFLNRKWPFINLKFAHSSIITLPKTFIFIPEEFENTDQESIVSQFLDSDSNILCAKIENTIISTYFTIDQKVLDFQNILSDSKVVPSTNLLIQKILSTASGNTEIIGINVYQDDFELVYVKNEQFIFYNRFPKANADDFNYYLLSVFEQFGIQAATAQFYLAGDIHNLDVNYGRLSKYSSHIHFLANQNKGKISKILESNFSNQLFLLSELSKCV